MLRSTAGIIARRKDASPFVNDYSIEFDGVSEYINVGDISSLDGSTEATWSFWTKFGTLSGNQYLMSQYGSASADRNFYVYRIGSSRMDVSLANVVSFRNASLPINTTDWFHICITFNGNDAVPTDRCKFYLNGTPYTNAINGNTALRPSPFADFHIGKRTDITIAEYNGAIDEFSIFDNNLSASQVSTLYNSGVPTDVSTSGVSGLLHYWRFGDGTGDSYPTIKDLQGSHDGTMINMTSANIITDAP